MRKFWPSGHGRLALNVCAVGTVAGLMAGCSSDATRMSDPFGNPFASNEPVRHVASVSSTIPAGRSPPVVSRALPAREPAVASTAPLRPQVMTSYNRAPVSHETTGSIEPAPFRTAPGASYGSWTSSGGVGVTVAQGDTVEVLSKRYGVPPAALLQTNGFRTGAEIQPGTRLTIPVYNAVAARKNSLADLPRHEVAPDLARSEPAPRRLAEVTTTRTEVTTTRTVVAPSAPAKPVATAARAPEEHGRPRKVVAAETEAPAPLAKPAPRQAVVKQVTLKQAAAPRTVVTKTVVAVDKPAAPATRVVTTKTVVTAAAKPAPVRPAPARLAAAPAAPAAVQPKPAEVAAAAPPAPSAPAAAPAADNSGNPEFRWPARGRIIQGFKGGNDGINIAVPEGTAVKAAENGTVAYAGSELKGYGNLVLIRHPNGFVTAYANNGELDVKRGDQVKRGQVIAKSGQSGNVSSPQLHFELRKGSTPVDPTQYLAGL